MIGLLAVAVIILIIIALGIIFNEEIEIWLRGVAVVCLIAWTVCTTRVLNIVIGYSVVIEKSSDSDWTYSTNQTIKRDTTITVPKMFIKGKDTIITLPTTEYKIIEIR